MTKYIFMAKYLESNRYNISAPSESGMDTGSLFDV